ncbi:MAG: hypothetical protein HY986_16745 [Candidatus Melainabacteria bacterium]|nr:hypothetical protein [Candidatus Melainabacteria bacterium]
MARFSEISNSSSSDNLESRVVNSAAPEQPGLNISDAYPLTSFAPPSSFSDSNVLQFTPSSNAPDRTQENLPALQLIEDKAIGQDIQTTLENYEGKLDGRIKVVSSAEAGNEKPNFIVGENGSIKMEVNPDTDASDTTIVQVATADGAKELSQAQRESLTALMAYIEKRMQEKQPEKQMEVENALDKAAAGDKNEPAPTIDTSSAASSPNPSLSGFSPQTQASVQNQEQFTDGSSGSRTSEQVGAFFPKREGEMLKGESQEVYHLKNAIAGLFNPNKENPYETVRSLGDGKGMAVGRYGLKAQDFLDWLEIEDLSNLTPEQLAKHIAKLAKAGKLPKDFAAKFADKEFAAKFIGTLQKMAKGEAIEGAELKELMPPALQEQVAADLVDKNLKAAGGDMGKAALALQLGKSPAELSQQDLNDAGNKLYMRAARQLETISQAGQGMQNGDSLNYTVSPDGNSMQAKIARAGEEQAAAMGTTGRCAEGVQLALNKLGINKMGTGNGWEMKNAFLNDPKWQVTTDPREASICFRDWTSSVKQQRGADYGHVALLHTDPKTGKLMETSDHETEHHVNNARYSKTIYMKYVG